MPTPHRLDPRRVAELLPHLYRAARAWTGSSEEAEDLVQDLCVQVLARPRLVLGDDLGYLMRALHNTLTSRRRTQARRPATVELDEDLDAEGSARDDPEAAAENAEVLAAIRGLPEEFRDALVAIDVAGLSYKEAARLLGLPEGTVTSRLFRARDRLARLLADEDADPPGGAGGVGRAAGGRRGLG
jgi:RNA polymerase sigma-70 factor, ECF subfamily